MARNSLTPDFYQQIRQLEDDKKRMESQIEEQRLLFEQQKESALQAQQQRQHAEELSRQLNELRKQRQLNEEKMDQRKADISRKDQEIQRVQNEKEHLEKEMHQKEAEGYQTEAIMRQMEDDLYVLRQQENEYNQQKKVMEDFVLKALDTRQLLNEQMANIENQQLTGANDTRQLPTSFTSYPEAYSSDGRLLSPENQQQQQGLQDQQGLHSNYLPGQPYMRAQLTDQDQPRTPLNQSSFFRSPQSAQVGYGYRDNNNNNNMQQMNENQPNTFTPQSGDPFSLQQNPDSLTQQMLKHRPKSQHISGSEKIQHTKPDITRDPNSEVSSLSNMHTRAQSPLQFSEQGRSNSMIDNINGFNSQAYKVRLHSSNGPTTFHDGDGQDYGWNTNQGQGQYPYRIGSPHSLQIPHSYGRGQLYQYSRHGVSLSASRFIKNRTQRRSGGYDEPSIVFVTPLANKQTAPDGQTPLGPLIDDEIGSVDDDGPVATTQIPFSTLQTFNQVSGSIYPDILQAIEGIHKQLDDETFEQNTNRSINTDRNNNDKLNTNLHGDKIDTSRTNRDKAGNTKPSQQTSNWVITFIVAMVLFLILVLTIIFIVVHNDPDFAY